MSCSYRLTTPRRTECAKAPQEPLVQSFHAGQPAQHYSIGAQPSGRLVTDADKEAMRDFVELGLQAGRVNDGFTNVSDILRRLDVIAPDGALTNAAAVAFYKAPSAYPGMKLGLLAGNDKLDIFDLQQEDLPLIQLLKSAEFFVVSNIGRRFVFGEPGMQRREIPEIPREAVREAVANALCHRDYTTGTAVEVNVYMDFVEVVSPASSPRATRRKTIWREETAASSSATRASCRRSSARERSSSTARASPASSGAATSRA